MLENFKQDTTKHIVIVLQDNPSVDALACGNALYSYFLSLHKKVSFYCADFDFDVNFNFLPWIDKLKKSYPFSSDYKIQANSSLELFKYFSSENIKLNSKMSTSLYAGILDATNAFSKHIDGTVFAAVEVLIKNGADTKICNDNLINYQSLATLRLKGILLNKIKLENDATLAIFELEDKDLISSGAKIKDAYSVITEALGLPTVKNVRVIYKNKEIFKEDR